MIKNSLKNAMWIALGAAIGRVIYLYAFPHPEYSAPTWVFGVQSFLGAYVGAFITCMILSYATKRYRRGKDGSN